MTFYKYGWAAFNLLIIIWAPIVLVFGWGGLILMMIAKDGAFLLGLRGIGLVAFPLPLMYLAYLAQKKTKTRLPQWFILYCFWFLIFFIGSHFLLAALGGLSMATVDNATDQMSWNIREVEMVTRWMVLAQPLIIALVYVGQKRLKAIGVEESLVI